jgi:energy-coupling factor transporter ATP-binding protein EcfA2
MSEESKNPLHVVELRAENIKILKVVRICPDGNVVVIGGENAQGKTTVLDCLLMAMGGAKAIPDEPLRRGQDSGGIFLDLGELSVEVIIDKKLIKASNPKGIKLVVRNADGKVQGAPQSILDKLYNTVAFNPLDFASQDKAKQTAILKRLVGLDLTDLDAERNTAYEKRTGVGRVRADAEARVCTFPASCATAPDEEVSVADLMAEKEAADRSNNALAVLARDFEACDAKVKRLTLELEDAKMERGASEAMLKAHRPAVDTTSLVEKIKGAEDVNRAVRAKKDRAKAVEAFKAKDREYAKLTDRIAELDAEKEKRMAAVDWPIPGLGFGEDGITFNDLPFEQASSAERLKVSLAIGMALNPRLRVLRVPDASLLDKKSMQIIRETAAAENFQMWLERVSDGDEGAVIIEDGEVAYNTEV